jgi:hypothetical protein
MSASAVVLTHGGIPLNIPVLNRMNRIFAVAFSSIAIAVLLAEMGIVLFLTHGRPFPKLDLHAPDRGIAKKGNVVIVDLHGAHDADRALSRTSLFRRRHRYALERIGCGLPASNRRSRSGLTWND